VILVKTDCKPDGPNADIAGCLNANDLLNLYDSAAAQYERARAIVEEMIDAVQCGADFEAQSAALKNLFADIALVENRILAANQTLSTRSHAAGDLLIAAAQKHLTALSQLCDKVRAAERAAAERLLALSPRLDASIRSRAMVSAYRQHCAS
jgi:hypothetical protein